MSQDQWLEYYVFLQRNLQQEQETQKSLLINDYLGKL